MLTVLKTAILLLRLTHPVLHAETTIQAYAQRRQLALALSIGGETAEGRAMAEDYAADRLEGGQR